MTVYCVSYDLNKSGQDYFGGGTTWTQRSWLGLARATLVSAPSAARSNECENAK